MNIEEIKQRLEQIKTRKDEIAAASQEAGADLDALVNELNSLNAEENGLDEDLAAQEDEARTAEAKRREIRTAIGNGTKGRKLSQDGGKPAGEVRNSKEYIEAYARFVKTGDASECRALLSTNATNGTVAVPDMVDDIIRTAWDKDEILSRVRKTDFRGNVKVPFEISATDADVHTEGSAAPTEEELKLGIVTMIPANIKKWIKISDEVYAMAGETFLNYIYRELTHKILKKLADLVVADITGAPTAATKEKCSVAKITGAPSVTIVAQAFANLSDEAESPCIVMNKLTYADFVAARAAGNFAVDPFYDMPVLFNNSLPAYSAAAAGKVYMFVGDLNGEQVNYPEGEGVITKFDDLTEAEADLIKVVGRQYVAHGLTACGRFCNVAKG